MVKAAIASVAAAAALVVAAPAALAGSTTLAQKVVACVYDSGKCATSDIGLAAGDSVTFTKQKLADACRNGGYAFVGTENQGQCVSFVEHALGSGATVTATGAGSVEGLRSGDGGLIANITAGDGGMIANLVDGNGGLIAN
jgi:hypothetical protein